MASGGVQSNWRARENDALLGNRNGQKNGRGRSGVRLGKRPTSSGSAQTYDDEEEEEEEGVDDHTSNVSDFSHVLLDSKMTYSRLIWSHLMSLLPCVALLLATIMLAWHAPCHIHQAPKDTKLERQTCSTLLNDRVSLTAFGLGMIFWLASHALRPAIWIFIELVNKIVQSISSNTNFFLIYAKSTTFLFILVKTSILELLRLLSILLGNSLIYAGLLRIPSLDKDIFHPLLSTTRHHIRWNLHWYDPRFTIAVWVAIGWAITEFLVTSWQMFDRLALYEIDFDEDGDLTGVLGRETDIEEGEISIDEPAETSAGYLQHRQHLSDSDTGADYSDSAATVKAGKSSDLAIPILTTGMKTRINGRSSPGERLREARRRVINAAGESGFSIGQNEIYAEEEGEQEELGVLREKLDMEMEGLNKARERVELEATFGQPLTSVPIALCTLWRIDGWLWNLGSTLLLSASVTIAQGPLLQNNDHFPILFPPFDSTLTTLTFLIALHTLFTTLWTTGLPTFGFAFVTYASMLAGVGLCISASARWGLLV